MKISRILLFALLIASLSACEEECEPVDVDAINAVYIELKTGGENGFTQEELNNTYLVRYLMGNPNDSIYRDTTYSVFHDGSANKIKISNSIPWENIQPPHFPIYTYIISNWETYRNDTITNIELDGSYIGDCEYENYQKQFAHKYQDQETGEFRIDTIDMGGNMDYYLIEK